MSTTADEGRYVLVKFCGDAKPDWTKLSFYTTSEYASTQAETPGNRVATFHRGVQICRVAWPAGGQDKYGVDSWNTDAAPAIIENLSLNDPHTARLKLNANETLDDKVAKPMVEQEEWESVFHEPLPDGTEGIMLRGAELGTLKNNILYPAWGNALIAHHNDDEPPTFSTFVHDMEGTKKSETYKAKLNSSMWVKLQPKDDGCAGTNDEPAIAWNCTTSRGEATGWGFATFMATETRRVPRAVTGAKAHQRNKSKQAAEIKQVKFEEFGAAKNVNAWLSFEQFGFAHPGDPENDKHAFHKNSDGERTNSGHIWTNAYFYMNRVMDGPINFIPGVKPTVSRGPIPTDVLILWNPALQHPWKCGPKDGKWDPMTFQPNFTKEPKTPEKPPPTDWTPLEREGPSWYPIPKPCVLKGKAGRAGAAGNDRCTDTVDTVANATGIASTDWAQTPRIAHIVATGKLAVTTANAGKAGIAACPPDYTVPPTKTTKKPPATGAPPSTIPSPDGRSGPNGGTDSGISVPGVAVPADPVNPNTGQSRFVQPGDPMGPVDFSVVDALNSYVQGTSVGVLWHAEPELDDYQLRHDFDLTNVTTSVSTYGIHNKNVLGFGRASDDFGSVVDGFRINLDGSKNLCITPVKTDGTTDTGKSVDFKGPVTSVGSGVFGYWSRSGTTISTATASDALQIDGNIGIGVAPSTVNALKVQYNTPNVATTYLGIDFAVNQLFGINTPTYAGGRFIATVNHASGTFDDLNGSSFSSTVTDCGVPNAGATQRGGQFTTTFNAAQTLPRLITVDVVGTTVGTGATATYVASTYIARPTATGTITNANGLGLTLAVQGHMGFDRNDSMLLWPSTTTQYTDTFNVGIRRVGTNRLQVFNGNIGTPGNAYIEARQHRGNGTSTEGFPTLCNSSSDTDTGVYFPGANQIALTVGASKKLHIVSDGQVRIARAGSATDPAIAMNVDINTGPYAPAADVYAITVGGVEAWRATESGGVTDVSFGASGLDTVTFDASIDSDIRFNDTLSSFLIQPLNDPSGVGGAFVIAGQQGASTSAGGDLSVRGGAGGGSSGVGGKLQLRGGATLTSSQAGAIDITGGESFFGAGGDVKIDGGAGGGGTGDLLLGSIQGSVNLGRTSMTTAVTGGLSVAELAAFNGDVDLGNANTDLISIAGAIDTDVRFLASSASFLIQPLDYAGGTGKQLDIKGQKASVSGAGGVLALTGGEAAAVGPPGGDLILTGGPQTNGVSGTGGDATIDGGTGTTANGDVNVGVTNAVNINIGKAASKIGFYGATAVVQSSAYTVTNLTTDRTYDADAESITELADVVGTLIGDLQSLGLIG